MSKQSAGLNHPGLATGASWLCYYKALQLGDASVDEGLCVQIMHIGPYDDEPATVAVMDRYVQENGYVNNLSDTRLHHEIYLSDARKVEPAKRKTVIRHPIRKVKCL